MENKKIIKLIIIIVTLFIINPIYFVQSGQKAVIKRFGIVRPYVINEGMHLKFPLIDQVITLNVTPFNIEEEVVTYTKDNQAIDIKFNIIATFPQDDISNTVVLYNANPYNNFSQAKIFDAFKAVAGKYTASDFVSQRESIRKEVLKESRLAVINEQNNKPAIKIIDVPITNVDFDDQYEAAIREKQVAQQKAQKAEYVLQQARIDAQSKIAKAEGEAKSLQIKAQAISKNPSVVRLEEIQKWDGHFPLNVKVIGGATLVDTK